MKLDRLTLSNFKAVKSLLLALIVIITLQSVVELIDKRKTAIAEAAEGDEDNVRIIKELDNLKILLVEAMKDIEAMKDGD